MVMQSYQWWEEKGEDAARCLFDELKVITQKDSSRLNALQRYTRLYTGRDNVSVGTFDLISRLRLIPDVSRIVEESLRFNVIQSAINTLHSKMCKRKERVRLLTDGGSWQDQRNAQRAERLLYGLFMSADVHRKNMLQTLDSYWAGSGFVQVGHRIRKGKIEITVNRIHPSEIVVDFAESEDCETQTLRRIKAVPVDQLIKLFPDKKERIEHLQWNRTGYSAGSFDSVTRKVLVAEAWHLPHDDGTGGKHVLAIENDILREEDYTEFDFPIIKQDYLWAPIGYFGIGVAELLQGYQRELDQLLAYRLACLKRGANPRTYVEKASLVDPSQLNNDINPIVEYSGTPPVQETRAPYSEALARDIEEVYQKAFREVGVSELSASSQKPAGLNSGKALREFSDIESERFFTAGQHRQQAHIDIAKAMIREVKLINKLSKTDPDYRKAQKTVQSYDRDYGIESFDLEDLDTLGDEFVIQMHNTSMFPQKPEGQLEFAQELAQAGLINQQDALELLDFPDTSRVLNRQLAATRFTRKTIEQMLDSGVFMPPDPYEDHARNFQIAKTYYDQGKLADYDEELLELLRKYMDANDRFVKMAEQAALADQQAAAPMPPEAGMEAMPMAPEQPIEGEFRQVL
jgi:hypothetical protein